MIRREERFIEKDGLQRKMIHTEGWFIEKNGM